MSIWKQEFSLEQLGAINDNSMGSHLGIEFVDSGEDFLSARMPVDGRTKQPYGIMHGGASCVLAEAVASIAGYFCVDQKTHYCVGVEINTSHIKTARSGWVIATAKPLHLGHSTQVWEVPIYNEEKQLISMSRLRLAVLERPKK